MRFIPTSSRSTSTSISSSSSIFLATLSILTFLPTLVLSQAPTCVINCLAKATRGTDCATIDLQCLCTNQNYIDSISTCLFNECKTDIEKTFGANYAMEFCAIGQILVVITPSAIPSNYIAPGQGLPSPLTDVSTTSSSTNSTTNGGNIKTSDGIKLISLFGGGGGIGGEIEIGKILVGIFGSVIVFGFGL